MAILTTKTELATTPADGDLVHIVDVSDTTDNAAGTSKKITRANLVGGLMVSTILTATGTIDDSNTAFTFTSKPLLIFINGLAYAENGGWTWSVSTATLSNAVGTGGTIFGIV